MHTKDNLVPSRPLQCSAWTWAQLTNLTSSFPCVVSPALCDVGCANRPEMLFLPHESAPGLSLLCHVRGPHGHTPRGPLPSSFLSHPVAWSSALPAGAPPPHSSLQGPAVGSQLSKGLLAVASGQRHLLQHLWPLPHRHRPSRFLWARAGPAPGRDACGFRPSIPLSAPPASGRCLQDPPRAPGPRPDPSPAASNWFRHPRGKS